LRWASDFDKINEMTYTMDEFSLRVKILKSLLNWQIDSLGALKI